jgi:HAD superfamily hydrolase (TIGR01549 family)
MKPQRPIQAEPPGKVWLWLFDFDNTIALLEPEVDWAAGRRELEAFLRAAGVADEIFVEIPKGNLPLYEALRARLANSKRAPSVARGGRLPEAWGANGETLLREASAIIERHELAGIDRAEPTQGAIELLKALASRGKTIAIVTSNSSRTVKHWLEHHHLRGLVRTIVGRDTLLALKPSPAMVLEALRQCGGNQQDTVFVGDSTADLSAAQAAGIGFYGVATAAFRHENLSAAGAKEIFVSPAALRSCLNFL